jgi:hypothetical protein
LAAPVAAIRDDLLGRLALRSRAVAVDVRGTGVIVREATAAEIEALARWRRGAEAGLAGSFSITDQGAPGTDDVPVVATAFVEFDGQRWTATDHHGRTIPADRDATLELLAVAREAEDDLIDLLADMRIADLEVTRWELLSAPRRIELAPGLAARLAPLRRG